MCRPNPPHYTERDRPARKGRVSPPYLGARPSRPQREGVPSLSLLLVRPAYFFLTLMALGRIASFLGSVSVSTPFSKTASAFSTSTGTFNVSERANGP